MWQEQAAKEQNIEGVSKVYMPFQFYLFSLPWDLK